jgi:hypothetical protein
MLDLNSPLVDSLLEAITSPLDERSIHDYSMAPWCQPIGIAAGPTTLTFYLRLVNPARDLPTTLILAPAMEAYVAAALHTPPGQRCPVRLSAVGAHLVIEVPRADPYRPTLTELEAEANSAVLLGLDARGLPVLVDLLKLQTGLLTVATSGGGKTNALAALVIQALLRDWSLALIDLKGGKDWEPFTPWAPWGFATTDQEAADLLTRLQVEVDQRNRPGGQANPLLLVFDELPSASKETQLALANLTRVGRSAGLRTLAGAQRLGRDVLPMTRQCLRSRLVGLCADSTEAKEATGQPGSGAEQLLGRGDMLLIIDGAPPNRVQVAQVMDEEGLLPEIRFFLRQIPLPTTHPAPATFNHVPRPGTLAAELARLEAEAQRAGDGREPPPAWLVARCTSYAQRRGKLPSFATIKKWTQDEMGQVLSIRRMREARAIAATLAGLTSASEDAA